MITVAVIAWNRSRYLRQVVASLRAADYPEEVEFLLFNDGPDDRDDCQASVRAWDKLGQVFESSKNLHVVGNYKRAEEHCFITLKRESAYFIADDCCVEPHYFRTVHDVEEQLGLKELPFVNSISGWDSPPSPLERQLRNAGKLSMGTDMNMLSYGGQKYERWRRLMKPYYDIRYRDSRMIPALKKMYATLGGKNPNCSSQDVVKHTCVVASMQMRIRLAPAYCKYIGAHGIHGDPFWFTRKGFHEAIMCPYQSGLKYEEPNWIELYKNAATWLLTPRVSRLKVEEFKKRYGT